MDRDKGMEAKEFRTIPPPYILLPFSSRFVCKPNRVYSTT